MTSMNTTSPQPVEKTPTIEETWFKPCVEDIDLPLVREEGKDKDVESRINEGEQRKPKSLLCQSTSSLCTTVALKGFEFCHKHILEDPNSPFKRCSYITKSDLGQCPDPAPKLGDKISYCIQHDEEEIKRKKNEIRNKNRKKKRKEKALQALEKATEQKNKAAKESSSEEEEYSFFTDSVQVNKADCLWLGNQASDAESTDSEDENPLNHAGVWTLEECIRICEEKMCRLRFLYSQQYKRLNYILREERRKMLNEYDMDPFVLAKVDFERHSGDTLNDYLEDVHLTNYQRLSGVELLAEKQMKEKRSKGSHHRRSDLPRCQSSKDGQRCQSKVLPFSRHCYHHIVSDAEQYLYAQCSFKSKTEQKCMKPADIFSLTCQGHCDLLPSTTGKYWEGFQTAMKVRETRKRKHEASLKEKEKIELLIRTRRTSTRKSECNSVDVSPTGKGDGGASIVERVCPNKMSTKENSVDDTIQTPSSPKKFDLGEEKTNLSEEPIDICAENQPLLVPRDMLEESIQNEIHEAVDSLTDISV